MSGGLSSQSTALQMIIDNDPSLGGKPIREREGGKEGEGKHENFVDFLFN